MFDRFRKFMTPPSRRDREQAYLEASANRYDLEMREREIMRGKFREPRYY
jgi:hypothetical protein